MYIISSLMDIELKLIIGARTALCDCKYLT